MPAAVRRLRLYAGIPDFPILCRCQGADHLRWHLGNYERGDCPVDAGQVSRSNTYIQEKNMKLTDVVILDGARTAIGCFGGSLSTLAPAELGCAAAREAISRAGVEAADIDHSVFGHIITTGPQDAYLARHIALNVGMEKSSAAFNVNRLCGSAVQSVISAAQLIVMGDSRMALAGGAESMSQG